MKVGNPGTATTLSAPGYTVGNSSITVGSTSNWATDTGVTFAIDQAQVVNGVEVQIAGTYNEYVGTVASGTSITNVAWVLGSGDRNYASGALTRVYIPVSAERENRIVEWGLVHADQDGTLKAGAVDNAAVLAIDVVETAKIKDGAVSTAKLVDGAVTNAKLSTTAGELGGAWASWTPTWTNVTIGNATVTGSYKQIGKVVHVKLKMVYNTTTSISGAITFSLPVAALNTTHRWVGGAYIEDAGIQSYVGHINIISTTTARLDVSPTGGTYANFTPTSATVPFTWGINDFFECTFTYEAA